RDWSSDVCSSDLACRNLRRDLESRIQANLHARIRPVVRILDKVEARFAKLFLRLEQPIELFPRRGAANDDGGIIARRALRVLLEPVACLGRDHLLIVGGEEADCSGTTDTTRQNGLRGPHEAIVSLDRAERTAGG